MATLNWIGKEKVINHHLDVPFRTLKHQYTYKDGQKLTDGTRSENKIIHGDNLEALKSLLPEYEGKIKCIYIDPPYNTGNEGWAYNDNVNHPKIKKWLGQVVGKEGEDLSRHDKWLCMMYPRVKLLHKLLSDDGFIFVSIDDNELFRLKLLMDEVFGAVNFVTPIYIQVRYAGKTLVEDMTVQKLIETTLIYRKSKKAKLIQDKQSYDLGKFNIKIVEKGTPVVTTLGDKKVEIFQPDQYEIVTTEPTLEGLKEIWASGKILDGNSSGRFFRDHITGRYEEDGYGVLYKVYGIGDDMYDYRYFTGPKKIGATKGKYYQGVPSNVARDINSKFKEIPIDNFYNMADSFGNIRNEGDIDFRSGKKPTKLIQKFINLAVNGNDGEIILDSFAGSGSTAHAVLGLNFEDKGNRIFITIELEDYAEDLTAKRIKNVISGYKNTVGTGGDFEFLELGDPLFSEDDYINEEQSMEDIRKYVYYSETRANSGYSDNPRNEYYLGKRAGTAYYFYYKKDSVTTLDLEFASKITIKSDQYIVYADKCSLSDQYLNSHNIIFKKIPRDITRI